VGVRVGPTKFSPSPQSSPPVGGEEIFGVIFYVILMSYA